MNMSCSACFLRFVRDWKVEGAGVLARPQPRRNSDGREPRVLTTWGARGRWGETQSRAAGWVLAYPAVFDLWLQEAGGEPFKALF